MTKTCSSPAAEGVNASELLASAGKGKPLPAIVERVGNGGSLNVTLLPDLQPAAVLLAGVQVGIYDARLMAFKNFVELLPKPRRAPPPRTPKAPLGRVSSSPHCGSVLLGCFAAAHVGSKLTRVTLASAQHRDVLCPKNSPLTMQAPSMARWPPPTEEDPEPQPVPEPFAREAKHFTEVRIFYLLIRSRHARV